MTANRLKTNSPMMPGSRGYARLVAFGFVALALPLLVGGGCMCSSSHAVPAYRLPHELLPAARSTRVPIDFTLLRQPPPTAYVIGPRDILGVFIQGVVPSTADQQGPSILNLPVLTQADYYPPRGMVNSPAVGLPMEVGLDGTINLPLIPPIRVVGLTIADAAEQIRRAYAVDRHILEQGRERVLISLIRPRVERVIVLRDDVNAPPVFQPQGTSALLTRRGTANVLDLPAYENDVLHAVASTGGLPGVDAYSTIWVFRARVAPSGEFETVQKKVQSGEPLDSVVKSIKFDREIIQIPLRVYPGEPLPFTERDIVLQTGDVVYVETRQSEYFFSGGLLPAGQIPLPRDYDLDVLGAVALATGSVGGPAGGAIAAATNFKGSSIGDVLAPTRVLILRTLANGEQVEIRVDLKLCKRDARDRICIQPGDMVMLYYKPGEAIGNGLLNIAQLNFTVLPTAF